MDKVKGGWISTVYGLVMLCDAHLNKYFMEFAMDSKIQDKMVICEVCHPELALERPKKFGGEANQKKFGGK